MPIKVTAYDLLISCPSDVSEFVPIIKNAINRFNLVYGKNENIIVRPVYWRDASFPESGDHPQALLNQQIVETSDFAVGVFWTKFGQPTEHYGSGTEEEIEYMLKNKKQVFLYFLDKPISPSQIDMDQYNKICEFKMRYKDCGVYWSVSDENKLMEELCCHLKLHFDDVLHGSRIRKNTKNKCILWVDDRPENNVYERTFLEKYGIEIFIALSTQQAMNIMSNQESISLIISDMGRKEGPREGYELLKAIRKTNQDIPFFIYAGSSAPHHIKEAIENGAQGCTNTPHELINLVIKSLLKQ